MTLLFTVSFIWANNTYSQVTIGANQEPQNFSILELISNNESGGLRLPQLDNAQRNDMVATAEFQNEKIGKARGLTIFNLSTCCIETWNGSRWIEQCADCNEIDGPTITSSSLVCLEGNSITFTASPDGYYKWQISSDNGVTWTDVDGMDPVNVIPFPIGGNYLVRSSIIGCNKKFSNTLPVQVYQQGQIPVLGNTLTLKTLNNVIYSYQYIKMATVHNGTAFSYQWYMKFAGYDYHGNSLLNGPAKDEVTDIIVGANQSTYTFDPHSNQKYTDPGTYYFYCKAFGFNSTSAPTTLVDSIFIRVEDLYDASRGSISSPTLITKEKWEADYVTAISTGQEGPMYFIPTNSSLPNLRVAHANLGSIATRDAGELGNLYQWLRNEDGHERRQYNGLYSNWGDLNDTIGFVSLTYPGPITINSVCISLPHFPEFACSPGYGQFIKHASNWVGTTINLTTKWGDVLDPCESEFPLACNTTDLCAKRNALWRIPTGMGETSDFAKLTTGQSIQLWGVPPGNLPSCYVYTIPAMNTTIYRYGYGENKDYGSLTVVSKYPFSSENKHYVAIFPASGVRKGASGHLENVGEEGQYWSSEHYDSSGPGVNYPGADHAYGFYFQNNHLATGHNHSIKSDGLCVRCVKEQ
ncbi:MAG: hypothetical protein LBS50_06730 [Prevotellaceae bacterium]|nr:hypothetical protein [Prevotellaceae bacterium]